MILELIFRNILVRVVGVYSRFLFYKLAKKEKMSINKLQGGEDEEKQYIQEFYNAVIGIIVTIILSAIIAYFVFS